MEMEPKQPPEAWPEDEMYDWEPSDDVGFDGPMPNMSGPRGPGAPGGRGGPGGPDNFRNRRYREAYGNYSGGYEQGGFRRPMFKPYDYSGPPFAMGPRGPGPRFPMGRGYGPQGPRGPMGPVRPMGPAGPMGPIRPMGPAGPMGPVGPPRLPMRSLQDRVVKFLMRCGMTKENVKNLPRGLVQLISPQHCGVCGMEFESFSVSRIHYGSKNHLKAQKKWIAQCNGETRMGNSGKELPLKSRDLYCELCDVHITSKQHAESHYAGKNHRAIVEGRKQPKNPYLLQEGMEGRVEQLIRREKRNLKADGSEEGDAKELKEPPPPKIGNPDLYCNICKTSMTNMEQMMMHLNGKRHLFKEKNHILRVMKGEPDPAPAPATEPGAGDAMAIGESPAGGEQDKDANGDKEQAMEEQQDASGDHDASTIDEWQNGGGEQW
ncbi:uncharacterized protein LOC105388221 [Plutella xylostella]|uniref:uncharacterized protein LOC105388221 n=1 Tax=Plutella xylostella TaxID=51655 RepID=UPI002032FA3D|nr:uncharacterized protein LOC105388221 [Plutella xylostella]